MARHEITLSANTTGMAICTAVKPKYADSYKASVFIYGGGGNDFGGGTVTLLGSPDGGTTKLDLKDSAGSSYTAAADDNVNIELGCGSKLDDNIIIYAKLDSSTAPTVKIVVFDNAG